jgi:hypothetical protein
MRKIFIILFITAFFLTFSTLSSAVEKKQGVLIKPSLPGTTAKVGGEPEQAKWERFIQARDFKDKKYRQYHSIAGKPDAAHPEAANIDLISGSTNWESDSSGDLVWMGLLQNTGSTGATFVRVDIDVYSSGGSYLGSDYTYAWGGKNVNIGWGIYTNALETNQIGFFRVWTNISYAQAYTIYYTISWDHDSYTSALALLDFYGGVYYRNDWGDIEFYGNIKNSSTNYVTYFTTVAFACIDKTVTYPRDVDYAYVDGSSYSGSSSAIQPGAIEPFEVGFIFASYSGGTGGYLHSFEWDEDATGGGPAESNPPFGQFATPVDGANVASSIAVTGWALDDSGVESVKIYRGTTGNLTYIGDAIFVDGARPDIASYYPTYPQATRAGWGYMLLTNFLPNGGNGTYTLHAIATDIVGKQTTLGTATIYCDNAHAVKPFGAIDTPAPGGDATGSSYRNVGWALTPQPNSIPTNGSTISVYIDGAYKGHATYNVYRADIASLFPGYANTNGALGYFDFDTTKYSNGLHTIFWIATDSGSNADGIGSRYFNISNSGSRLAGAAVDKAVYRPCNPGPSRIDLMPVDSSVPVRIKTGYMENELPRNIEPDGTGITRIRVKQLGRVELHLSNPVNGYMMSGGNYYPLPVGSTLDIEKGTFSWHAGAPFLGEYKFVFIEQGDNGELTKSLIVIIVGDGTLVKPINEN